MARGNEGEESERRGKGCGGRGCHDGHDAAPEEPSQTLNPRDVKNTASSG